MRVKSPYGFFYEQKSNPSVTSASEPESSALLAREKAETLTFPQPLVWATLVRARDWWTLCEASPQFDLILRIHAEGNHAST